MKIKRLRRALEVHKITKREFHYQKVANDMTVLTSAAEFFNYRVPSILYFNPRLKFIVKFKLYVASRTWCFLAHIQRRRLLWVQKRWDELWVQKWKGLRASYVEKERESHVGAEVVAV